MAHLTHHDILRLATPLISAGLAVDMPATDRDQQRIAFRVEPHRLAECSCVHVTHSLQALRHGATAGALGPGANLVSADGSAALLVLTRAVLHPRGLVSTVKAYGRDPGRLLAAVRDVPLDAQVFDHQGVTCARSLSITLRDGSDGPVVSVELQYVGAVIGNLELAADITAGAGMPADVLLMSTDGQPVYRRDRLANGMPRPDRDPTARQLQRDDQAMQAARTCPVDMSISVDLARLPDDLLAVTGAQFRPLVWRGDHWRTVLRNLGREPARSRRADDRILAAVEHLQQVLESAPRHYHATHRDQRYRVYLRRLKPALLLLAIFLSMPIIYLIVDRGGIEIHPVVLGITPLLMVATVALTAREIPIMELPPPPSPLPGEPWRTARAGPVPPA